MKMTGLFHLTVVPSIDDAKFEKQITEVAFTNVSAMQATRATAGFDHRLLKRAGDLRQYTWQVDVDLVSNHPYNFAENIERVQNAVQGLAVVSGLEVFTRVAEKN